MIQAGSRWYLCLLTEIYPMVPSDRADHLGICMYLRSTKINQILRYHARALAPAVATPRRHCSCSLLELVVDGTTRHITSVLVVTDFVDLSPLIAPVSTRSALTASALPHLFSTAEEPTFHTFFF